MRFCLFRVFVTVAVGLSMIQAKAQDIAFPKGRIVDSVKISETESYALYIPNSFSIEKATSVVFIFDPVARGVVGIKPFLDASEKYNYLLICSNNSRNGPILTNLEFVNSLFAHVFSSFTVDPKKVYVSGFSGGSRLAMSIAILTNQINAVVGCGAGISQHDMKIPLEKPSFNYVGIVGTRDMNFQEMFRYEERLEKFGLEAEIITYDGNHSWPPTEVVASAFDLVELKNKRNSISVIELSVFEENFRNNYEKAKQLEEQNHLYEAGLEYERLLREYNGLVATSEIETHLNVLRKKTGFKKQKKQKEKIRKIEVEMRQKFEERFFSEMSSTRVYNDYSWWKKELNQFKVKYGASDEVGYRKFYERTWYALYAMTVENAQIYTSNNNTTKSVHAHTITSLMYPEKAFAFVLLARDYARLDKEDKMIQNLEFAAERGYASFDTLFMEDVFIPFKNSEKFKALRAKY